MLQLSEDFGERAMNDGKFFLIFMAILTGGAGITLLFSGLSGGLAIFLLAQFVFFVVMAFREELGIQPSAASLVVPLAIEHTPEIFAGENVPYIEHETPTISGKLLNHFDDQSALSRHVAHLNDVLRRAAAALKTPPERFNADRRKVEAQQLVLRRLADQAAKIARKLEASFPKLKTDSALVPRPKPITLPAPPKLDTLANLADRQRNFSMAAGRAIVQGGNQGGPVGVMVAVVAAAAIGVIAFQKQVRAMEEAHGKLSSFLCDAYDDLEVLALAHTELVEISREVAHQTSELKELLVWAEQAEKIGRFAEQTSLEDEEIGKIAWIKTYALTARIDAARTV